MKFPERPIKEWLNSIDLQAIGDFSSMSLRSYCGIESEFDVLSLSTASYQCLSRLIRARRDLDAYSPVVVVDMGFVDMLQIGFSMEEVRRLGLGIGTISIYILRNGLSGIFIDEGEQYIRIVDIGIDKFGVGHGFSGRIWYRCFRVGESWKNKWEFSRCLYLTD